MVSASANGASAGNIIGVQVGTDGVVSAVFDNNQVRKIAQVAVATFPNADGLQATSGNAYVGTLGAGAMTLKVAGAGGAGTVDSSSLEASTVDLSSPFFSAVAIQNSPAFAIVTLALSAVWRPSRTSTLAAAA